MGKAPKKEPQGTIADDESGIGFGDGNTLNVVDKDSPPFKPKVFDDDGNEIDPDEIQDDAPEDE